ncbi:MAG: hypothetical protein ACTSYA_01920 [Candidatus Kariarchaeaceae archaeon]
MITNKRILQIMIIGMMLTAFSKTPILAIPPAFDSLDNSTIEASSETIAEEEQTTLTVHALNDTSDDIVGAEVTLTAVEGSFASSGTTTATGLTDISGVFQDDWTAPTIDYAVESELFEIIAEVSIQLNGTPLIKILTIEITVVHTIPASLANSEMSFDPITIYSGQDSDLSILILDDSMTPIEGADISLSLPVGTFIETELVSDSNGEAITTWTAPLLTIETEYLNLTAIGHVVYHGTTEEEAYIYANINVEHLPGVALDVTVIKNATEVNVGDFVSFEVTVNQSSAAVDDALVSISAELGTFTNDMVVIEGSTDAQGKFSTIWEAPEVELTQNISFIIQAVKDLSSGEYIDYIAIVVPLRNFTLSLSSQAELTQGEDFYVDLLVEEEGVPFEGAVAQFSTSGGEFVISESDTYSTVTNSSGEVRVWIDTSEMTVFIGGLDINISVIVTDDEFKFNSAEALTTSHADKYYGTLEGSVGLTPNVITIGANASLSVSVTLDSIALENASVRITATGGAFDSSETNVVSGLTDENGDIIFVWMSKDLPSVDIVQNIVFSVQVNYEDYDEILASITITVNPVDADDDTSDDDNNIAGIVITGLAGVAVIGTVTVVLLKKK